MRELNRLPLGLLLLSVVAAGCTGGSQSADLALNKAITATGGTKGGVAKFSGKVTIDGKPPGEMGRVPHARDPVESQVNKGE